MQVEDLMYLELKDVQEEDLDEPMQSYILCYDNIWQLHSKSCHSGPALASPIPHDVEKHQENYWKDYIWRTTNILSVRKCTVPMKPFLLVTTPWLQSKHYPGFPDSRKLPIPCHRHNTFSLFIGTSNAETLIQQSAEGKARNLSSQESTPSSY